MSKRKVYTPEGVYDILTEECFLKRQIEKSIRELFISYGYLEIETPSIEFYDIFTQSSDWMKEESMFKFFDSSGKILALRPDITIPIARMVSTKMKGKSKPHRLSYIGNVFRFDKFGGGEKKEFTQAGVELLGVDNPSADAEIIALAIRSLIEIGLTEFQIDIGQVEFFKGIMECVDIDSKNIEILRELIDTKNALGIEDFCFEYDISGELKEIILILPELFGGMDVIDRLKKFNLNERALMALDNLTKVLQILDDYGFSKYISLDMGIVQKLNYYTGVIFRGFTYGVGFPIVSGGRYNNVYEKFGDKMTASGFSLKVNMVMMALERQKISLHRQKIDSIVAYTEDGRKNAIKICEELRLQGLTIELDVTGKPLAEIMKYAKSSEIDGIIYVSDAQNIELHNIIENQTTRTTIKDLLSQKE